MAWLNRLRWFGRGKRARNVEGETGQDQPARAAQGATTPEIRETPHGTAADGGEHAEGALRLDADPEQVGPALERLLRTTAWNETRDVLEREQGLLLTQTAELLLAANAQAAQETGTDEGQARGQYLLLHLALIHDAREHVATEGIGPAWERFMAAVREREGGGDGASGQEDALRRLRQTQQEWQEAPTYREERRYLEQHRELLEAASEALLEEVITEGQRQTDAAWATLAPELEQVRSQGGTLPEALEQHLERWRRLYKATDDLRERLALLRDIGVRRGRGLEPVAAIREAYVNWRGGWTLDLPAWLEDVERRAGELRTAGAPDETAVARAALLREALREATREHGLAGEIVAELQARLWDALDDVRGADQQQAQEEGLTHLAAALAVYTPERFPLDYAMTQNNLGNVYAERIAGERGANQEQAIACYQAALAVRTRERFPIEHRDTQLNLAILAEGMRDWRLAHTALDGALTAEDLLVALGAGVAAHTAVLRQGRNAATRDGYALLRLGRPGQAAAAIERGRARACGGTGAGCREPAADPRCWTARALHAGTQGADGGTEHAERAGAAPTRSGHPAGRCGGARGVDRGGAAAHLSGADGGVPAGEGGVRRGGGGDPAGARPGGFPGDDGGAADDPASGGAARGRACAGLPGGNGPWWDGGGGTGCQP